MVRLALPRLLAQEPCLLGGEPGARLGRPDSDLIPNGSRRRRRVHPGERSSVHVAAGLRRCPMGRDTLRLGRVDSGAGEGPGHLLRGVRGQLLSASQAWLGRCGGAARPGRGSHERVPAGVQHALVKQTPRGVNAHQRRRCHG